MSGAHGSNEAAVFVSEYFERKTLSKLGYRFDPNELTQFQVQAFMIVESEINKYNNSKLKKK
jgi:hypothetical protein